MTFAVGFTLVFLAGGLGGSSGAFTDYLPTICQTICNPNPGVPLRSCLHKCGWVSTGIYYDGSMCWLLGRLGKLLSTTGVCKTGLCVPNLGHHGSDAERYCNEGILTEDTTGSNMSEESKSTHPAITVSSSTILPDLKNVSTARTENISKWDHDNEEAGNGVTTISENRTQEDKGRDSADAHEPSQNVTDTPGGNQTTHEIPAVSDSLLSEEGGIISRNESTPEPSDKHPGVTEAVTTVGGEHSSADGKDEPQDDHESHHGDTHKPSINVTETPNVNDTTPPISDLVDGSSSDESRHGSGNKSTSETSDRNTTVTEPASTAPGDDVTAIGENRTQDDKERDNGDVHEPRKNVTDTPGGNHITREIPTVSDSLLSQEGGIASRSESTPETSDKHPGVTEAVTTVGGEHSSGDGTDEPQDGHESHHGDTHKPSINVTETPNVNDTTPPISDLVDGSSSDESRHGSGNKSTAESSDRNTTVTEPVSTAAGAGGLPLANLGSGCRDTMFMVKAGVSNERSRLCMSKRGGDENDTQGKRKSPKRQKWGRSTQ